MASAIHKTFKCIEALARSPAGLTVSEVASVAGFSRPAATRLLDGLLADTIVIRDPKSKRYRLGLRLYDGHDAVNLQPDAVPRGTLDEAGVQAGHPDLHACPRTRQRCGGQWNRQRRCHCQDQQAERANG